MPLVMVVQNEDFLHTCTIRCSLQHGHLLSAYGSVHVPLQLPNKYTLFLLRRDHSLLCHQFDHVRVPGNRTATPDHSGRSAGEICTGSAPASFNPSTLVSSANQEDDTNAKHRAPASLPVDLQGVPGGVEAKWKAFQLSPCAPLRGLLREARFVTPFAAQGGAGLLPNWNARWPLQSLNLRSFDFCFFCFLLPLLPCFITSHLRHIFHLQPLTLASAAGQLSPYHLASSSLPYLLAQH